MTPGFVFAESTTFKSSPTAQQPGKRLSSSCRPITALSRLAKLAKTSPSMSPGQALPEPPKHAAAAEPLPVVADRGRAHGATTVPPTIGVKPATSIDVDQAAAEQVEVVGGFHGLSQQEQQQQEGTLHGVVNPNVAVCSVDIGDASRQSQAGMGMLLW